MAPSDGWNDQKFQPKHPAEKYEHLRLFELKTFFKTAFSSLKRDETPGKVIQERRYIYLYTVTSQQKATSLIF